MFNVIYKLKLYVLFMGQRVKGNTSLFTVGGVLG
jgi:hypothetical protein